MSLVHEARTYRERGEYQLALTCAQGARGGRGRIELARVLIWLGRYPEAVDAARTATLMLPNSGPAWAVFSEACNADGQPEQAIVHAQKAMRLDLTTPIRHALDGVALAGALHSAGQGEEAVQVARLALAELDGADARAYDRAQALQAIAESLHVAGRYSDAADVWRQTLDLRRAHLDDPQHPEIGVTINGMALTVRRLGLVGTAVELHQDALAIYEARFDDDHPAIAACLHGLAQALHRHGKPRAAREHLARALEASERRQGGDHIHTWITRFELGRLEADAGDLATGYRRMEAARLRLTEKLGPDHPTVQAMRRWLS